ncbi:MAG TPA: ABC transporter permease [Candidatus Acidoferrales bacterium]|nr:ABC transporter permease [Candidatus Acidoferrales bacterium]
MRNIFKRGSGERELDDELRFDLERRIQANLAAGMTPEEAGMAAKRDFGSVDQTKEECRDARGTRWLEDLWQDARFGLRMLRRNPGFAAVAILTLALGIGANTAVFSVVEAILLRPLPYADPSRLVELFNSYHSSSVANFPKVGLSPGDFADWKGRDTLFSDFAAYSDPTDLFNMTGLDEPQRVRANYASSNLLPLLGVRPIAGRNFLQEEDKVGGARSVLLSHALWEERFGGDAGAVGRSILLDGVAYNIAGVLPAGFPLERPTDLWIAIGQYPDDLASHVHHDFMTIARLKPRASVAQAQQEMDALNRQAEKNFPDTHKSWSVLVAPLQDPAAGKLGTALWVSLGIAGFVLLIACANFVNLLLARNAARQRETALRAALGAGQARIIRQFITESVLLSAFGGVLGLGFAAEGLSFLKSLATPDIESVKGAGLHGWVLAFAFGVCMLAGIACGLVPAFRSVKADLNSVLKEANKGSGGGANQRLQGSLVVAEVALCLVPLISAGLLIQSMRRLLAVDPGFRADHLLTMQVPQPNLPYAEASKMTQEQANQIAKRESRDFEQLAARIRSLPGVEQAGGVSALPLTPEIRFASRFVIEGRPVPDAGVRPVADIRTASLDYFAAMRIPLIQGRWLQETDWPTQNMLINQTMARKYWPDGDALGKRFNMCSLAPEPCWFTIVGVVGDVSEHSLDGAPTYDVYGSGGWTPYLVIHTISDPASLFATVAAEVHKIDPSLPITEVTTMQDLLAATVAMRRFSMLLLAVFAALALVLAAVGIYGVMSYAVSRRTQEIGIRVALGAQTGDIQRMVIGRGVRLALAGTLLGLSGAFGAARLLVSMLYGVRPADPAVFLGVSGLLIAVALLACWIPARRAMRVDPIIALRYE